LEKQKNTKQTNWADVVIRAIDLFYYLFQTGNIFGVIIAALIGWIFLLTFKVSPEYTETSISSVATFLRQERFYFFPISIALFFSVITNIIQFISYKKNINILTKKQKQLTNDQKKIPRKRVAKDKLPGDS